MSDALPWLEWIFYVFPHQPVCATCCRFCLKTFDSVCRWWHQSGLNIFCSVGFFLGRIQFVLSECRTILTSLNYWGMRREVIFCVCVCFCSAFIVILCIIVWSSLIFSQICLYAVHVRLFSLFVSILAPLNRVPVVQLLRSSRRVGIRLTDSLHQRLNIAHAHLFCGFESSPLSFLPVSCVILPRCFTSCARQCRRRLWISTHSYLNQSLCACLSTKWRITWFLA